VYLAAVQLQVNALTFGKRTVTIDDTYECIHGGVIGPGPRGKKPPSLTEMQALMAKNAPALAKARQGFAYQYGSPPMRSFNTLFPEYARFRSLARTMMADGDVLCATGKWDAATERYLDIMHLGADVPHGGPLISDLVGIAIQAIGRAEVWTALEHASGPEAKQGARRLEGIAARQVRYANVLPEEKWGFQASLMELFQHGGWRSGSTPFLLGGMGNDGAIGLRMLFVSKRTVMHNYTTYMDGLIASAEQPFPQCTQMPALPDDAFNRNIVPVLGKA
jgi:hypothetical protein